MVRHLDSNGAIRKIPSLTVFEILNSGTVATQPMRTEHRDQAGFYPVALREDTCVIF